MFEAHGIGQTLSSFERYLVIPFVPLHCVYFYVCKCLRDAQTFRLWNLTRGMTAV